ncbi:hybrid sensor histidine kinase/response regulator transcription factor [Moheibacter sediminis]|uniref:histidine kinase n=1 Tax=Moheibacter sediminis TaxID=1434700 RepID=A0A1W1ZX43_9FLAO|nr:tetratricopeptide repeat protein [Moheibacter sediminis]SMC52977.1 Signal transduction histidine kinase [Moheibacter sediminis]
MHKTKFKPLTFEFIKPLFTILLIYSFSGFSFAQNTKPEIDSLLNVLSKTQHDTVKINAWNQLAWLIYRTSDYDSAYYYINKAIKLSDKIDYKKGKAKAYNTMGTISLETGDYNKGIENFLISLDLKKQIGENSELASTYGNLGIGYAQQGAYHEALKYFHDALKIDEEANDEQGVAACHANIGLLYYSMKDYSSALKNYFIAHKIYKERHQKGDLAMSFGNIGNAYNQMGNYPKALEQLNSSLKILNEIEGREYVMTLTYNSVGEVYKNMGNLSEALIHYKKALQISEEIGDLFGVSSSQEHIGGIYMLQGNPAEAKKWISKALDLAKNIGAHELNQDIYKSLSEVNHSLGNYKEAYENHQLYTAYKDSLFNEENTRKITRLEMDREFVEKENQIAIRDAKLETQRKQKYLYLSGLIGLCGAGGFFVYQNKQRKKISKQQLEEKQKVADALLELDKTKSRFLTNITHEFRTPLTLIKGQVELMKQKTELIETESVRLNEIEINSQILLDLINKLLDLSKLESGTFQLHFQNGNLLQELKNTFAMFDSLAQQKNIDLKFEIDCEAETFFAKEKISYSRDAVVSITANLLSNALKFTQEKGKIQLKISHESDFVNIYVIDNGLGIPAQHLSKIFDRFYQADDSSVRNHGGSGIGLALVKELAILHGGDVSVKSEQGKGTEFKVQLNISNEVSDEILRENKPQDSFIYSKSNSKNAEKEILEIQEFPMVLVVEDNADLQKFIQESLGNSFNIKIAENGEQGFEMARTLIPDLIISDVMMPKMNGIDLSKNLKSNTVTSHIPVILLTAKSGEENKLEGLQTGADDYLIKPFSVKELIIRTNNLIQQRKLLRTKFSTSVVLKPEEMELTSRDTDFLNKIISIVEKNITNAEFGVENLAEKVSLSTSQLNRKLKAITNQTTVKIIRNVKLQKAYEMLRADTDNIAGIAYSTGFESPGYFTKVFKEHFGFLPSDKEKMNEKINYSHSQTEI